MTLTSASRLVPARLKRFLQQSVRTGAGTDALVQRIQQLEHRITELESSVFDLSPEVVSRPPRLETTLTELLAAAGESLPVNLNISKNDLMYRYLAKFFGAERAQVEYVKSGVHMMQVVDAIVHSGFGGFNEVRSFLDFASGYGRLTRFLVQRIPPERVWISEIKARAVEFQRQQFGVHGFVSSETPDALSVSETFDVIFVGSLFSHLPEDSFARWLQRLSDLLSARGIVIFTVHDISLDPKPGGSAGSGLIFHQESEEYFVSSADTPLDLKQYGSAYVAETFVQRVIQNLSQRNAAYARYEKAMWGVQDIYVLSPSGKALSGLTLPSVQNV